MPLGPISQTQRPGFNEITQVPIVCGSILDDLTDDEDGSGDDRDDKIIVESADNTSDDHNGASAVDDDDGSDSEFQR